MNLERFVIFLAAAFFLIYGLAFSIVPASMALFVTGGAPDSASALVDFRATYGGMTLAVGVLLAYLYSIGQIRACLIAVIIVLMSMAVTRTLGWLIDGPGNFLMVLYLALEVLGSAFAFFAVRRLSGVTIP